MNQMEFNRELLSFDEKIRLAKLEESKAAERVCELEYQKARFSLDVFVANMQQEAVAAQPPAPAPKPEGQ